MAWSDIPTYITTIETAVYGKDMREAIADSIQELYSGTGGYGTDISNLQTAVTAISQDLVTFFTADSQSAITVNLSTYDSNVDGTLYLRYLGNGMVEYKITIKVIDTSIQPEVIVENVITDAKYVPWSVYKEIDDNTGLDIMFQKVQASSENDKGVFLLSRFTDIGSITANKYYHFYGMYRNKVMPIT